MSKRRSNPRPEACSQCGATGLMDAHRNEDGTVLCHGCVDAIQGAPAPEPAPAPRNKGGRPRLNPERSTRTVAVRLTPEAYDRLAAAAAAANTTMSELLRQAWERG